MICLRGLKTQPSFLFIIIGPYIKFILASALYVYDDFKYSGTANATGLDLDVVKREISANIFKVFFG